MSSQEDYQEPFRISVMLPDDVMPATKMRTDCWIDTYVNEDAGVTLDWVIKHNQEQLKSEKNESRIERLKDSAHHAGWVAKDLNGNIIGSTTPFKYDDGRQDVGSLYVAKEWQGKGVATALMQKVINWFDAKKQIELVVASYNERAKAFYRKWGFKEVPNSSSMFNDVIPSIKMIRKGETK